MTFLHAGDQLDHYRIEKLVADSGMASIFRGTDLRNERAVAIKVPHPEVKTTPPFRSFPSRRRNRQNDGSHPAW